MELAVAKGLFIIACVALFGYFGFLIGRARKPPIENEDEPKEGMQQLPGATQLPTAVRKPRDFSKKLRQWTQLRPMWVRSRCVAQVALVVVVAVGVFTLGAWMEARVSALEQKVVTGSTGRIVPFRLGSSSLESRVSELESSVSALKESTGTGRFSIGGSLESRVSALESKVAGGYPRLGVGSDLSSLERRVSALERGSRGY